MPEKPLPELREAQAALARRQARAVISLIFRIVALAMFSALLMTQVPAFRPYQGVMDALCGVLALWPFFTETGRLYAWRIALGRSYAKSKRWADTEQVLTALQGWRSRLFDATGEGRYWLATALLEQGDRDRARRVFASVVETGGEWAERAREAMQDSAIG